MLNNQKKIYEQFHRKTGIHRTVANKKNYTYREIFQAINILIPELKGNKVLDVGCGSGTTSFYLAKLGFDVIGIDISENAISCCRKSSRRLRLASKTRFYVVEFPSGNLNGKFDLVICSEVMEHIQNENKGFKKIYDFLKKDGILLIAVPSSNCFLYRCGFLSKFDREVGHLRRYTTGSLMRKLQEHNFKTLEFMEFEGFLRNFLFASKHTGLLIHAANKFPIVSDVLTFLDSLTIKIFGESQIVIIARKID